MEKVYYTFEMLRVKKKSKKTYIPSRKTILATLAFIVASGGAYEGYSLYKGDIFTGVKLAHMTRMIDGDTFEVENGERVRLASINAPEQGECYAKEASEALENLLKGKTLRLQTDVEDKDNFGRSVRYVTVLNDVGDNIVVNRYMVENGYAKYASSKNILLKTEIVKAESRAQAENVGLWKDCPQDVARTTARRQELNVLPSDPKCVIKGNISSIGLGKIYILPHCANYGTAKIDPAKGEAYFCTEEEAEKNGFKKADGCR